MLSHLLGLSLSCTQTHAEHISKKGLPNQYHKLSKYPVYWYTECISYLMEFGQQYIFLQDNVYLRDPSLHRIVNEAVR